MVWDLYDPATRYLSLDPGTQRRAASTDVDVEHDIQSEHIDAAQRQGPARASGRVTFLQHCIFYATSYQSRAAAHNLCASVRTTYTRTTQASLRQYVALTCYLFRASSI